MKIKIKTINSNVSVSNNLINYLSQIVLSRNDDEIKDKQRLINKSQKEINEKRKQLVELKKDHDYYISLTSKEKQIHNIVLLINSLNKEGAIFGKRRTNIIEYLKKINTLKYEELIRLHQKISLIKN